MKKAVESLKAPKAIGPFSQAIETDSLIFISGQLPINAETNEMAVGIKAQTRQSLENIKAILKERSLDMNSVVKTTVFLKDMKDFADMNEVYAEFCSDLYPARMCCQVVALPKDALIEIEAIATK